VAFSHLASSRQNPTRACGYPAGAGKGQVRKDYVQNQKSDIDYGKTTRFAVEVGCDF